MRETSLTQLRNFPQRIVSRFAEILSLHSAPFFIATKYMVRLSYSISIYRKKLTPKICSFFECTYLVTPTSRLILAAGGECTLGAFIWYPFLVNPLRACAGLQYLVCVSVCYHVFCHRAQQCAQQDIPAASAGHEQSFKNGVFLVQKLWRHLLTAAASGAVAATLSFFFRRQRLLKLLKRLTVG